MLVSLGLLLLGFWVKAEENKKTYNLTIYLANLESSIKKQMNKQAPHLSSFDNCLEHMSNYSFL